MGNRELAYSYFKKCQTRTKMLSFLMQEQAYSDVVREAQELAELAVKGMLRFIGIEPPRVHDASSFLAQYKDRIPILSEDEIKKIELYSKKLRRDREASFYGDIDLIPTEVFQKEDAQTALEMANFIFQAMEKVLTET